MKTFQSKPIQLTYGNTRMYVLCEDGSIHKALHEGGFKQIAAHEAPKKAQQKKDNTQEEAFTYFWDIWKENVKCASPRKEARKAFMSLSKDDCTALVYSVPLYAKTQPVEKHQFLKRAPAYINSGMFLEHSSFVEDVSVSVPGWEDPIWQKEIAFNGIIETAYLHIHRFDMNKMEALKAAKAV